VGYATTVMKQVGPSYAVGYNIIEERSATSQTNPCQHGLRASYATKLQKEGSINVDIADVVRDVQNFFHPELQQSMRLPLCVFVSFVVKFLSSRDRKSHLWKFLEKRSGNG
jgi:hypothetical protein